MDQSKENNKPVNHLKPISDAQFMFYLRSFTAELKRRKENNLDLPPSPCPDLFAAQDAIQQALIANKCLPL